VGADGRGVTWLVARCEKSSAYWKPPQGWLLSNGLLDRFARHRLPDALGPGESAPIDISMGAIDTSGYGGGPAQWLADFPEINRRIAGSDMRVGVVESRFDYWQAAGGELRVALDTTTSDAWSATGRRVTPSTTYNDLGRSMPRLLAAVLHLGTEK